MTDGKVVERPGWLRKLEAWGCREQGWWGRVAGSGSLATIHYQYNGRLVHGQNSTGNEAVELEIADNRQSGDERMENRERHTAGWWLDLWQVCGLGGGVSLFQDGLHADLSQVSQEREADGVEENTGTATAIKK